MTEPTLGTEASLNIDSIKEIKEIMDGIDPEALLPQMNSVFEKILLICRIAVLIGPIILLILGLIYLFLAPKEANHYLGYRCYYGMGSIKAWLFTQRLAGIVLGGLGALFTVIMLFVTRSFSGMEMMDVVWRTVYCLIWEAVLTTLGTIGINATVTFWYNRNGELRKRAVKPEPRKKRVPEKRERRK